MAGTKLAGSRRPQSVDLLRILQPYCQNKRRELCDIVKSDLADEEEAHVSSRLRLQTQPVDALAAYGRVCNLWTAAELEVAGKVIPLCKG